MSTVGAAATLLHTATTFHAPLAQAWKKKKKLQEKTNVESTLLGHWELYAICAAQLVTGLVRVTFIIRSRQLRRDFDSFASRSEKAASADWRGRPVCSTMSCTALWVSAEPALVGDVWHFATCDRADRADQWPPCSEPCVASARSVHAAGRSTGKKRKQACKLASTAIHDQHAACEGVNQVNMVSTCLPSQCSEHFAPVAGPAWSSSNEKTITSVDGDSPDDFYFADSSISRTTTACDGGIPKVENLACLHE